MIAGMIALELNSVTRIHNEISFSDGEMPATHHRLIQNFVFSSYYVTYNKSLSSLIYRCNEMYI